MWETMLIHIECLGGEMWETMLIHIERQCDLRMFKYPHGM
jgi:hypothetical protein